MISVHNVSNPIIVQFALQTLDDVIQNLYQIPTASIAMIVEVLLERVHETSNQSKTNYLGVRTILIRH